MAVKTYGIHDKWLDINKLNSVDVKSVDGVIESVKINGEEAGGGGGDFSVANVTITQIGKYSPELIGCCYLAGDDFTSAFLDNEVINKVILYKGGALIIVRNLLQGSVTVSGNAVYDDSAKAIMVSGDCTITIS